MFPCMNPCAGGRTTAGIQPRQVVYTPVATSRKTLIKTFTNKGKKVDCTSKMSKYVTQTMVDWFKQCDIYGSSAIGVKDFTQTLSDLCKEAGKE